MEVCATIGGLLQDEQKLPKTVVTQNLAFGRPSHSSQLDGHSKTLEHAPYYFGVGASTIRPLLLVLTGESISFRHRSFLQPCFCRNGVSDHLVSR